MRMFRVLLAAPLDEAAEARLAAGAEVLRPLGPTEGDLIAAVRDCDALVVRTNIPVSRTVLTAGKRLRVVGVAGVGVDQVDTVAAEEMGVQVLHTPGAASDAVAELAVGLMVTLLRPIHRLASEYRAGRYSQARAHPHGRELRDLTVGILGMGRIGSRVGRICAAGFGSRVLYHDIVPVGPFEFHAQAVSFEELISQSDIVTLHVPLTPATRHLLDREVLGRFRRGALLVNTARGAVVETEALVDALGSGRLGGAALDVTQPEPLPEGHPLFEMSNCIVLPHIAARTYGGLQRMYGVVDDVLAFLAHTRP
jgi:phosphoglycerate dehydrogenase-like enzyme